MGWWFLQYALVQTTTTLQLFCENAVGKLIHQTRQTFLSSVLLLLLFRASAQLRKLPELYTLLYILTNVAAVSGCSTGTTSHSNLATATAASPCLHYTWWWVSLRTNDRCYLTIRFDPVMFASDPGHLPPIPFLSVIVILFCFYLYTCFI